MNRHRKLERKTRSTLALSIVLVFQTNSRRRDNSYERNSEYRRGETRERPRGKRGGGEGRGKSARLWGREAITKLQKLTIKPDRHTGSTIKLAGRPADRRIFLAFTTNHVATRRTSSDIYAFPSPRAYGPRGWILPAERKLHGDFAPPFEMPL